jgi:bacterioferritin-associated ferredoxin
MDQFFGWSAVQVCIRQPDAIAKSLKYSQFRTLLKCEAAVIVCSCNMLSDTQILGTLQDSNSAKPCSPARAYRGLGCSPRCGRCVPTIRKLLARAHIENCGEGCRKCPADEQRQVEPAEDEYPQMLLAAE